MVIPSEVNAVAILRLFSNRASHLILGFLLIAGIIPSAAQQESDPERQYREDYERIQKIVASSDAMQRAEQLFAFIKGRPNSKLVEYAQGSFYQVLEGLIKAERFEPLLILSERYIRLRPRAGETYYFYGAALKNAKRYTEAMNALAKCYLIRNPVSRRAKDFLEFIYKSQNRGSLLGMEAIIKKAQGEVGK